MYYIDVLCLGTTKRNGRMRLLLRRTRAHKYIYFPSHRIAAINNVKVGILRSDVHYAYTPFDSNRNNDNDNDDNRFYTNSVVYKTRARAILRTFENSKNCALNAWTPHKCSITNTTHVCSREAVNILIVLFNIVARPPPGRRLSFTHVCRYIPTSWA